MDANSDKRQNNEEPAPPGTTPKASSSFTTVTHPDTPRPLTSIKGVENAKKRLRAFSIQKKTTPMSPIIPKPISTGNTTVLIGKLSSVKTTEKKDKPKVEDDAKKPPKPPKPGSGKKSFQDSYPDQQKRTLKEIEDMKRKMELVELGIPLGLICPTSTNEKAMPTKAMPPIKTFLDEAKVDEIIREAKKIKGEGKEFKFDYNKLLPDYDNPFQRKKDDFEKEHKSDRRRSESTKREKKTDKYEFKRHPGYRKSDKDKYKERDRERSKDRSRSEKIEFKDTEKSEEKEIDINLKDYAVCDSWSAENDDKTNSPKVEAPPADPKSPINAQPETTLPEKVTEKIQFKIAKDPSQQLRENLTKKIDVISEVIMPIEKPRIIEKLQPVMDSFKFEIDDPNDDEVLDIFDEDSNLEKYSQIKSKRVSSQSPVALYDEDVPIKDVDASMDMNDDTFLESVINEIRQDDNMCDESSQDKRLVEYDESPNKDEYDSPVATNLKQRARASVTPELDEKMKEQTKLQRENFDKKESKKRNDFSDRKGSSSQRSNYSDGRTSTESGYKTSDTTESHTKFENFRLSVEKELDEALAKSNIAKATMESMETWSFVLKICQPLLFRHDRNKCIRVTESQPKITYATNPKGCLCIKDRVIVYQELEMLKMGLVDRVYGHDPLADTPSVNARAWYPVASACLAEGKVQPVASEWEADDSQQGERSVRSMTPQRSEEIMLDREYQRFMEAVWPEVAEVKSKDASRSTTPTQQDSRQKKKEDKEDDKKAKKIKLSSEGWSQESDIEVEPEKRKKTKDKKSRKRKRSTSSASTISDSDTSSKKKRKLMKKKALKKAKSKEAKRRRIGKKLLKKLKEKQKKQKAASEDVEFEKEKKKELKKAKKRKQEKLKKKNQKRKKKESSSSTGSSSSSSSSSSDSDSDRRSKKRKRSEEKQKRQKRKKSSSDSQEDLFDVNILNNIKTERLTDDEKGQKLMEFSPRVQHKLREIINVKELQNDFVGNNNIMIKQEVEDKPVSELQKSKEVMEVHEDSVEAQNQVTAQSDDKSVEVDDSVNLDHMVVSPPMPSVEREESVQFKEPLEPQESISGAPIAVIDESNLSQSSSQESICSVKETSSYEKDESHLRPSSQNSNYNFNDVIASQGGYQKGLESIVDSQDKYAEGYEHEAGNYEMYEQLAMAYQSDVASQASTSQDGGACPEAGVGGAGGAAGGAGVLRRIETVVGGGARARAATAATGEIKCDWRADRQPAAPPSRRPSRWGLKPSEVNIVLTSGDYAPQISPQPVYKIQSLANRTDVPTDYDEAYMDMYGASDRLQYGDCFATDVANNMNMTNMAHVTNLTGLANLAQLVNVTQVQTHITNIEQVPLPCSAPAESSDGRSTLDARIDQALRETVLGDVAKDAETAEEHKDVPEKGILLTGNVSASEPARGVKRVSFADGYKPGQDSDVEDPPIKKRRARGCAWPCPASHADHVPLWDALPPPPPPPGDPPAQPAPPAQLAPPCSVALSRFRRALRRTADSGIPLGGFMPPEPPPGLISF